MKLPSGNEKARAVEAMFDRIADRYDLMNRLMTFGADRTWRRRTIDSVGLRPGQRVLDLACGTGDLAREAVRRGARAVGIDFSARMLARGAAAGLRGRVVRADAAQLALRDRSFDAIVSGFALRNFTDIVAVMRECARVLVPGGRIALLEVDTPRNAVLRLGHRLYFHRMVPLVGRMLADRSAYEYLPSSVVYLPKEPEMFAILREAGFDSTVKRRMFAGAIQLLTAERARA